MISRISAVNKCCNMNPDLSFAKHNNTNINCKDSVSTLTVENHGLFKSMKNENNRLNSFNNKWPLDFISTNELAKYGFFYLLSDDKVQCAFCKLILAKWEVGDKPSDQHQKFSPSCSFFVKFNEAIDPRKTNKSSNFSYASAPLLNTPKLQKAKVPKMSDIKKRLLTYKGWSVAMISIEDLALCGLFYTGVEDVVTCFSCGISLGDWKPYDEPMAKHSKFYPNCIFLHLAIRSSCLGRKKTVKLMNTLPELILKKPSTPSYAEILKSELIQKAKEIFPPQLVDAVVLKHLKETGEVFSSLQHLCDKVLEYEEKKLKIRLRTTEESECSAVALKVSTHISYDDLKSTKDTLLCKICLTEELKIAFQPCGHLISCDLCSQKLSKCPICRLPILKRIKTFLS